MQSILAHRATPVVVSFLIILVVAYLRERSRLLAVLFATMPINLPLALWIVFSSDPAAGQTLPAVVRSMAWGLSATMLWLLVVWVAVRAGWTLPRAVGVGYVGWALLLGGLLVAGILRVPPR